MISDEMVEAALEGWYTEGERQAAPDIDVSRYAMRAALEAALAVSVPVQQEPEGDAAVRDRNEAIELLREVMNAERRSAPFRPAADHAALAFLARFPEGDEG